LGYKLFVIEVSDKDLLLSTDLSEPEKERFFYYLDDLDIRICFYIKSKNHVVSTDPESKKKAKNEIIKIGDFIEEISAGKFDIPLICHIGGANGNRRKSMTDFCKFFDTLPWRIQKQIAIINDEKPSLFSVKDLLSVTYVEKKIPIVFRTRSHRTNQGGLTYKESFFLAASTWAERSNPLMFYCPITQEETISTQDLNPYNLIVDVAFDNNLPEPY
jgi:UV DNA damage repair endonuclease